MFLYLLKERKKKLQEARDRQLFLIEDHERRQRLRIRRSEEVREGIRQVWKDRGHNLDELELFFLD